MIYKNIQTKCIKLLTRYYCLLSGLHYNPTWKVSGKVVLINRHWFVRFVLKQNGGELIIGDFFNCGNKIRSNSIGLIQPCVFNYRTPGSKIIIGNNVGISGSTINATCSISIGNDVLIGSGCLITDTDSHPITPEERELHITPKSAPITICNKVFVGARCIIMKGVRVGEGAVVGAGAVVTKDVPPYSIVVGNPAVIVKKIKEL